MGILKDTHEQFIERSAKEAIVQDKTVYLCYLTNIVRKEIKTKVSKVYVTTRMLKHIYDKRPAEEYEYLINNLHTIVKYPDCGAGRATFLHRNAFIARRIWINHILQ